jgi:hypothetical protein
MERRLVDQSGSVINISSSKWPGEYKMSCRFSNGNMHLMFIKDVKGEIEMLKGEGYVEAK